MADSFLATVCMQLPDSLDQESIDIINYVLSDGAMPRGGFPEHLFFRYNESVPRYQALYSPFGVSQYRVSLSRIDGFGFFIQTSIIGIKGVDGYHQFILFFDWVASLGVMDQVIGYVQSIRDPSNVDLLICKEGKLYADPKKQFFDGCQLVNP
ncbi:hypothetical protein [Nitrincola sp. MINF-07-Sa-05]|uniref:hypothetical protein n=1 Tax=Nitrincola salilacus TaxID=3400273 RepID=UPI003917C485